jgi:hypothetical protein
MKLAIMQPYIFPYIGYFQLMNAVDEFIIYDAIKYTKKGWINRNRILVNNKDAFFTLPLKKDSDFLFVKDRVLADNWDSERIKIMNRIAQTYKKSPYFEMIFPLLEKCFLYAEKNLFSFIYHSILELNDFLDIKTKIIISSTILIDQELKSQDKVLAFCKEKKARTYINPIGGMNLYNKDQFKQHGIELQFLKTNNFEYKQFANEYIPFLSIIDVLMFNSKEEIKSLLNSQFTII